MSFINSIFGGKTSDKLKLTKDADGEWVVKKGSTILYIGSKDKCQVYLSHTM
jgi:hypothetical protein